MTDMRRQSGNSPDAELTDRDRRAVERFRVHLANTQAATQRHNEWLAAVIQRAHGANPEQLRELVALAIRADLQKAIPPWQPYPGGPALSPGMGRTEYDLAAAALAVVQPELDWLRVENGRLRTAWHSARHRANHNHLAGRRFPGGAVREALVRAGYIARRDTVATAVEKINKAPRPWYVGWLVDRLQYFARAHANTVTQAKEQARRADQLQAERDEALARLARLDAVHAVYEQWKEHCLHPQAFELLKAIRGVLRDEKPSCPGCPYFTAPGCACDNEGLDEPSDYPLPSA
jgi:hypothetical protein